MSDKKLKIFPLMISKQFMADHPRRGESTDFRRKIILATDHPSTFTWKHNGQKYVTNELTMIKEEAFRGIILPKFHTIRTNYAYWARVAEKVNSGRGILSLRQWTGSPYNRKRDGSKPVEFLRLEKMGVQRCQVFTTGNTKGVRVDYNLKNIHEVAKNDGLSVNDFCRWFKKDVDGCVIHFTDFRYG